MYIHTITKDYPVSEQEIRNAHPNTAFPHPFVPPDVYANVFVGPGPDYDPLTQTFREVAPERTARGNYEQRFEVIALEPEVIAAKQAEADRQHNTAVQAQLQALDLRRIRPLAEGDTEFLASLNDQITALRATLRK